MVQLGARHSWVKRLVDLNEDLPRGLARSKRVRGGHHDPHCHYRVVVGGRGACRR